MVSVSLLKTAFIGSRNRYLMDDDGSVILDEAQCIKNRTTRAAKAASELQALSRFCMSGTPMMNNVTELYSLIHFLRIKPYNSQERFNVVCFRHWPIKMLI